MREYVCDAPHPSIYVDADGNYHCRCVICARCGKHTGNAHQGHYWSKCKRTGRSEGFHFCCPDLPCEYPAALSLLDGEAT